MISGNSASDGALVDGEGGLMRVRLCRLTPKVAPAGTQDADGFVRLRSSLGLPRDSSAAAVSQISSNHAPGMLETQSLVPVSSWQQVSPAVRLTTLCMLSDAWKPAVSSAVQVISVLIKHLLICP